MKTLMTDLKPYPVTTFMPSRNFCFTDFLALYYCTSHARR